MGIRQFFEKRGNPLNNPAVPLSMAGFLAWAFGGEPTASGELINVQSSMQQATVYACVRVLADAVASLPARCYRITTSGKQEEAQHPIAPLLAISPNDEMTAYSFWETMVGCLHLTGNCYAQIQRSKQGRPIGLWPLNPQCTAARRDNKQNLYYETSDGEINGRTRQIAAKDVLHVPLFSFDGITGLSPIALQRQGIGLARAAEKYGSKWFGNGARPGGILTNKGAALTPEQNKLWRDSWNESQGGQNQGRTAVLTGDWSYQSIGISPEDSQFLETRMFQRTEIAAIFKVPPSMVGDTSRMSNKNAEQMNLTFVIDTLRPILMRFEQESKRKLFPDEDDLAVEFDVSERLRGDFKTTMDALGVGKQWGILNTNDCLRMMRLNCIGAVGDVYWSPVNMQNSERLLDTESIQDQPVGAVPKQLPAPKEKKSLLAQFELQYALLFRDAIGRLIHREKRATVDVEQIMRPVLEAMAAQLVQESGLETEQYVAAALKSLASRAQDFSDRDVDGVREFRKALRTIYINVQRDKAAKIAEEETNHAA